jgi:Uma2 family endonuclease
VVDAKLPVGILVASNPVSKLTEGQYLAIERAAEFRSEFLNGEMFAMLGASTNHARLQQNLSGELYAALRGGPCEAFGSDFRIRVSSRMYTYPGVSVVCGGPRVADDDNLLNPVVIFEVLSPSTERHDRGRKWPPLSRPIFSDNKLASEPIGSTFPWPPSTGGAGGP